MKKEKKDFVRKAKQKEFKRIEKELREDYKQRTGRKTSHGFVKSKEGQSLKNRVRSYEYRRRKQIEGLVSGDKKEYQRELKRLEKIQNVRGVKSRINLIRSGVKQETPSVFRVDQEVDWGPIFKVLGYGGMDDLFREVAQDERDKGMKVVTSIKVDGQEVERTAGSFRLKQVITRIVKNASEEQKQNKKKGIDTYGEARFSVLRASGHTFFEIELSKDYL